MAVNSRNEPFRGRPFNTDNRRQCFNVTIVNDDSAEDTEHFTMKIMNSVPSALVMVRPAQAIVTILDRDTPREWNFRYLSFWRQKIMHVGFRSPIEALL